MLRTWLKNWIAQRSFTNKKQTANKRNRRTLLAVEGLEVREVLSGTNPILVPPSLLGTSTLVVDASGSSADGQTSSQATQIDLTEAQAAFESSPVTPAVVVDMIDQLARQLGELQQSDQFEQVLPFTKDLTIAETAELSKVVKDQILNHLRQEVIDPTEEINQETSNNSSETLGEEGRQFQPTFETLHELVARLENQGVLGQNGINYDTSTKVFTIHLQFSLTGAAEEAELSFETTDSGLTDLDFTDSKGKFTTTTTVDLVLGIQFRDLGTNFVFTPETPLSNLNRGNGVPRSLPKIEADPFPSDDNEITNFAPTQDVLLRFDITEDDGVSVTTTSHDISVPKEVMEANENLQDLVDDINEAITATFQETPPIEAFILKETNDDDTTTERVVFVGTTETITSFHVAGAEVLGFQAADQSTTDRDFQITLSDDTVFDVTLGNASTVGDIVTVIQDATSGQVTVVVDEVTKGFRLEVSSEGPEIRSVKPLDKSPALFSLGVGFEGFVDPETGLPEEIIDPDTNEPVKIHVVVGAPLHGDTVDRLFFVKDPSITLSTSVEVNNAQVKAQFGLVPLELSNSSLNDSVSLSFAADDSQEIPIIDIAEILSPNGIVSGDVDLNLAAAFQSSEGTPNSTTPDESFGIDLTGAQVVVSWNATTDEVVETTLLDGATSWDTLAEFDVAAFNQAIDQVVGLLVQVESQPVFTTPFPVLNQSVSEMLGLSQDVSAFQNNLKDNPPTTLADLEDRLESVFGVTATFELQNQIIDITLPLTFKKQVEFRLDEQFGEEFGGLVGLGASSSVIATLESTNSTLGLLVDISQATPVAFLKNNSALDFSFKIDANNISMNATAGVVGVFIEDGTIRVDDGTDEKGPATFAMSVVGDVNGSTAFSEILSAATNHITTEATGKLEVSLPTFFPSRNNPMGSIEVTIDSMQDLGTVPPNIVAPDFSSAISDFDLKSTLDNVVDGFDRAMQLLEDAVNGELVGLDIPLVGDQLDDASEFLRELRERITQELGTLPTMAEDLVKNKLFEILGAPGLGWLADLDKSGVVDNDDIRLEKQFSTSGILDGYEFEFDLEADLLTKSLPIDVGLDAVGLDIDGSLNLDITFDMAFGFGITLSDGFYLTTEHLRGDGTVDKPELELGIEVSLSNFEGDRKASEKGPELAAEDLFSAQATLGFLQFTATDAPKITEVKDENGNVTETVYQYSHLKGTVSVDLKDSDGKLTLAEVTSASGLDDSTITFSAEAYIGLQLTTSFGNSKLAANLPSFGTTFVTDWRYTNESGSQLNVSLDDLYMDPGDFINNTAQEIKKVLDPVIPIAKALNTRIPLISDLEGRDFTLLDLAERMGSLGPTSRKFVDKIIKFANFVENLEQFTGELHFGSMTIISSTDQDVANPEQLAKSLETKSSRRTDQTGTKKTDSDSLKKRIEDAGFEFPLLDNPIQAFQLLLGEDVDLIVYRLPKLEFSFDFRKYFPIVGPLGATLSGNIGASAEFSFGYDTRGIRQFIENDFQDLALAFNGFYVGDLNAEGVDVPELQVFGGIGAYASANLGIIEGGVGGGIATEVNMNLHDGDDDGKLYVDEIVSNIRADKLFDVAGAITGFLEAYLTINFLFFKKTFEFEITRFDLVRFSNSPSGSTTPELATTTNGELRLNVGPYATQRLHGNRADGNEKIEVFAKPGAAPGEVTVRAFGQEVTYTGVTSIFADGGAGNDTITIAESVHPAITVELRGGKGNDELQGGSGLTTLYGGEGDDLLKAGSGAATIYGEEGNDVLVGGANADSIYAGQGDDLVYAGGGDDFVVAGRGNDTVHGEAGNDSLIGEKGDDLIDGGDDNDTISAGDGTDIVSGGDGDDTIDGGRGLDRIDGGTGNDSLLGGDGDDAIRGDAGDDIIHGGLGNDRLEGNEGLDQLFGELGNDFLKGNEGADFLDGGVGQDDLRGGEGNDILDGSAGIDKLFGDAGNDILDGGSAADLLYGGDGNDLIDGGQNNDIIYGNAGADTLRGNAGDDMVVGGSANPGAIPEVDNDFLDGGTGNDLLIGDNQASVPDGVGHDTFSAGDGVDTVFGGFGDDLIRLKLVQIDSDTPSELHGGPNRDTIEVIGTAGDDVIQVSSLETGARKYLLTHERTDVPTEPITTTKIDVSDDVEVFRVNGAAGDDHLLVNSDIIHRMQLEGGIGNDTLEGGSHDDKLFGGAGDDLLLGYDGADELFGDDGNDTLDGGAGTDALFGDGGADSLNGGDGADFLYGGTDDIDPNSAILGDILIGGEDGVGDIFYADDNSSSEIGDNDTVIGTEGDDVIFGGGGDDSLSGGDGFDMLDGGHGNDTLSGGLHRDIILGQHGNDILAAEEIIDYFPQESQFVLIADTAWIKQYNKLESIEDHASDEVKARTVYGLLLQGHIDFDALHSANQDEFDRLMSLTSPEFLAEIQFEENFDSADIPKRLEAAQADNPSANLFELMRELFGDDLAENTRLKELKILEETQARKQKDQLDPYRQINTGTDVVLGGEGSDTIYGSDGDDRISGDGGSDTIFASQGKDVIFGGTDRNTSDGLFDPADFDQYTDSSDDTYVIRGTDNAETFTVTSSAGSSVEVTIVDDQGQSETLRLDLLGIEVGGIEAGGGNDVVTIATGKDAFLNFSVDGGAGDDFINAAGNEVYNRAIDPAHIPANYPSADFLPGPAETFLNLVGGEGDDTIFSGDGTSFVAGDQPVPVALSSPGTLYSSASLTTTGASLTTTADSADVLVYSSASLSTTGASGDLFVDSSSWLNASVGSTDLSVDLSGSSTLVVPTGTFTLAPRLLGGNDAIYGGIGRDTIQGGDGADFLTGSRENDIISGGAGNDHIFGNDGNDTISGDQGDDTIFGGNGQDVITGGHGHDQLDGEARGDAFDPSTHVNLFLEAEDGQGIDKEWTTSVGAGASGGAGLQYKHPKTNFCNGDSGARNVISYEFSAPRSGLYTIFFRTIATNVNNDSFWVRVRDADVPSSVNLPQDTRGWILYDTPVSTDWRWNQVKNRGFSQGVQFYLPEGEHVLEIDVREDDTQLDRIFITNEPESDVISGDTGDDTIHDIGANDTINGGTGRDTFKVNGSVGNDTITTTVMSSSQVQFSQILDTGPTQNFTLDLPQVEVISIQADDGNDVVTAGGIGTSFAFEMYGGKGKDSLQGANSDDLLLGEEGDDTLKGSSGHDTLDGGAGNDLMHGELGNDVLYGRDGNDAMDGGFSGTTTHDSGSDSLYGGNGTTRFGAVPATMCFMGKVGMIPSLAIMVRIPSAVVTVMIHWTVEPTTTFSMARMARTPCMAWAATTPCMEESTMTSCTVAMATTSSMARVTITPSTAEMATTCLREIMAMIISTEKMATIPCVVGVIRIRFMAEKVTTLSTAMKLDKPSTTIYLATKATTNSMVVMGMTLS
ncbi:MAG: hypothetical protein ACFCD0_07075 [Gemmataceae bacterium]